VNATVQVLLERTVVRGGKILEKSFGHGFGEKFLV
jgi:hypothetical protein